MGYKIGKGCALRTSGPDLSFRTPRHNTANLGRDSRHNTTRHLRCQGDVTGTYTCTCTCPCTRSCDFSPYVLGRIGSTVARIVGAAWLVGGSPRLRSRSDVFMCVYIAINHKSRTLLSVLSIVLYARHTWQGYCTPGHAPGSTLDRTVLEYCTVCPPHAGGGVLAEARGKLSALHRSAPAARKRHEVHSG